MHCKSAHVLNIRSGLATFAWSRLSSALLHDPMSLSDWLVFPKECLISSDTRDGYVLLSMMCYDVGLVVGPV